jgi:formylglycine-generating enzyme required for sulfatase activity
LWVVALLGCEGERVESARSDAAISDSAPAETAETAVGGECGEHGGAKMVRVGSFCIDATEVTRGEFLAFLAAPLEQRTAARPPECAWNTTDPTINATASGLGNPVGEINFCDALAYCAWAGKRLCGRIGGGPHSPDD